MVNIINICDYRNFILHVLINFHYLHIAVKNTVHYQVNQFFQKEFQRTLRVAVAKVFNLPI